MRRTLLFIALAGAAMAQQRMLDYAVPRGGTRGSSVDITLHGRFLEAPKEILFDDACFRVSGIQAPARNGAPVKARVDIGAACRIGEHLLRIRTATALSEPVTFWVGRFPTVHEIETKTGDNDTPEKAQTVPLNSTVEGQILPGPKADVDVYRVEMAAGQRLSVEVEGMRLGTAPQGGENDLMVRVLDAGKKEIASAADSALFVQDPVLSMVVPRAGTYYVEIKQQIYTPPNLAYYRAHIGTFPRPLAVYPAGGPAGATIDVRCLTSDGDERASVKLPGATGDFAWFAGDQPPSPNLLRVSPYPNVMETAGDDPTPVPALPAALNGILATKGRPGTFVFKAKKNETWSVRVFARSLGSPLDPRIWIRPANLQRHIVDADDARLVDRGIMSARTSWTVKESLDPVALFKAPADGEYVIGIEDTRGAASPLGVYRIEIEPVREAMYTTLVTPAFYQIPRLGIAVPRGGRAVVDVQLAPGFGSQYKGDIALEARGLPRGVRMIAPTFAKGLRRMAVEFEADASAEPQAALFEVVARAADGKTPIESGSRQGFAFINRGNEMPLHIVFSDRFALAVTDAPPFDITVEPPTTPLSQSGELPLRVKVTRRGDFKGAVEIQPDWLPPNVFKAGVVTVPADKDEATFILQGGARADAGSYQIAMTGATTTGDAYSGTGRIRVASPFVTLKVAEPFLAVTLKRAAVERGGRGRIVATLEHKHAFAGQATIELKNLPRGVKMAGAAPIISATDKEVTFDIEASADALAGLYKDVTCEVSVVDKGQTIRQKTGSGLLRIDPARVSSAAQ